MIKESLYYGKILLFGEYGIIQDSMGLSIPYNFYNGKFEISENPIEKELNSNNELKKYLEHLKVLSSSGHLLAKLDLAAFEKDLNNGMHFASTIPQGFGVGSSGALVAAIYGKYSLEKQENSELSNQAILKLKTELGQMESYFHGKSSGLDPLICYLNLPILIKSKEELESVGIPEQGEGKGAIFLLNSGNPGKTQPMVNIFLEKCKEEGFRNMLKKQFKKYNDACIEAFLNKDLTPLLSNVKKLSKVALEHFQPMIPGPLEDVWKEGLKSNAYYLKLCGSGGGGFILGFTKDIDLAKQKLSNYQLDVIHRF
jgi:mevalonate kinase